MQLMIQNKQPYNSFCFKNNDINYYYNVNTAKNLLKKPKCLLEFMLSYFKKSYTTRLSSDIQPACCKTH